MSHNKLATKEGVDALLRGMLESQPGVSDLLFVVGRPPQVEAHGKLKSVPNLIADPSLTPKCTEQLGRYLMGTTERLANDFASFGSCDCSYTVESLARFRVNIFKQNGNFAMVLRKLASEIPSLDKLGLPTVFKEIVKERTGIIFVTGGTGSGKTTTLAALLNELNQKEAIHVVTLEDPIEFLHPHINCTFSQRELGKDFHDFATGLKAALRQAPKVILVGEIRDRETMEIAMTASETGHVVFSTLHTINAGQTINRIVGMFEQDEEKQIRIRLADTIRWIVSQRLLPKVGGGRIAALEIMGTNLRVKEAIEHGESEGKTFYEIMEASTSYGWKTFDMSILELYDQGHITEETALLYCTSKGVVSRGIDKLKKTRGENTSDISHLAIDMGYRKK